MKTTAIACALGAILVSFGHVASAQGFERGGDNQQRYEQRELRRHADEALWNQPVRAERRWKGQSRDERFERRGARHGEQVRGNGWRGGEREQLVYVEQEQRYEQPAYGPLAVVLQMPAAAPAPVAIVGSTERTVIRTQAPHPVAKATHHVARRAVVAKAATCAAPVPAKPRA